MKKVAVILSGCGVFDGAEIHESVLTLLCLAQQGARVPGCQKGSHAPRTFIPPKINSISGVQVCPGR